MVNQNEEVLDESLKQSLQATQTERVLDNPSRFIQTYAGSEVDLVTFNACLHEINTPQDQTAYLERLLLAVKKILKVSGKIVIADYFYDPAVTDQEFQAFIEYMRSTVGHADGRELFVNPDLILDIAQKLGFKILHFHQNRMVKEIDRKYYVFVLEKVN